MNQSKKSRLFVIVLLAIILIAPGIQIAIADSDQWQIGASTDDGNKYGNNMFLEADYFYWQHSAQPMECGFRFLNVTIPHGAIIESAYLGWTPWEVRTATETPHTIRGDDEDNCSTFSTAEDWAERNKTDASVEYQLPAFEWGIWHYTPDLKIIIQEIIDREGWESGNALALFTDEYASGALKEGFAWDWLPEQSPVLNITWSAISPPSDPILLFGAGFNATTPYVELHWNHSLVDVQFFEVQNSSDAVSWAYLGQSNTANYTDNQVFNGTERYYRVRACNQTGGSWYNSSWADANFEKVYFVPETRARAPPVDDYSIIFLAMGLIFCLAIYFLYTRNK